MTIEQVRECKKAGLKNVKRKICKGDMDKERERERGGREDAIQDDCFRGACEKRTVLTFLLGCFMLLDDEGEMTSQWNREGGSVGRRGKGRAWLDQWTIITLPLSHFFHWALGIERVQLNRQPLFWNKLCACACVCNG